MTAKLCDAVKHIIEYDSPDDRGITKREMLIQAGKGVKAQAPPKCVDHVWAWFWELNGARSSNGFGYDPVSYIEIKAWSELVQANPQDWEIRMIKAMDSTFLAETNKRAN